MGTLISIKVNATQHFQAFLQKSMKTTDITEHEQQVRQRKLHKERYLNLFTLKLPKLIAILDSDNY